MQASKQRTLRRRSVVTAPEVIRPLVHTTDEWWLACKETSPSIPSPHLDLAWTYLENNIPSPTWRTTFLHLLGEQHSFTYLENNIPSPHLEEAWTYTWTWPGPTWRTTFLHLTWTPEISPDQMSPEIPSPTSLSPPGPTAPESSPSGNQTCTASGQLAE